MKTPATHATVHIDASIEGGPPLSKERIAIYNSGIVPIERYRRDRKAYVAVAAESLRIDLGWGAEWIPRQNEVVRLAPGNEPSYDFHETDQIAAFLASVDTRPYWSYCYTPVAAQGKAGTWMGMGESDSIWVDTVRAYVKGLGARGVDVGYHEVYNEPDLRDERTGAPHFYTGDLDDYLDLYRATALAIREERPWAKVGGPALAAASVNAHWIRRFLTMVQDEDLPLDFLSFHHYGHFSVDNTIRQVTEILNEFDGFDHLELHLNEYNSFAIDYPRGGLQDQHFMASAFAADIPRLLGYRSITRTHWAQFQDSGQGNYSGMVDIDGNLKPLHHAYAFYQAMPRRRSHLQVVGPHGLGGLASADGSRGAAMIWNRAQDDLIVNLGHDWSVDDVRVTTIDSRGTTTQAFTGSLELQRGALALLSTDDGIPARPRRCVVSLPRHSTPGGWVDVDERSGVIDVSTDSDTDAVWNVILDTRDGSLARAEWRVLSEGIGRSRSTVHVTRVDDSGSTSAQISGASQVSPPAVPAMSRSRERGATRLVFSIKPAGSRERMSIIPEDRT